MVSVRKYRVLHIEDDEADRKAVARALVTQRNFTVTDASTLKSGMRALEESPFDAVILDLSLPDASGLLTVERVVAKAGSAPVIACTDGANALMGLEALERGASEYMIKDESMYPALPRIVKLCADRQALSNRLKDIERSWRHAESLFAGVLNVVDDAVAVVDTFGRLQVVNHAMGKLTGHGVGALIGQPLAVVLPDERREADMAAFAARASGELPAGRTDGQIRREDGSVIDVKIRSTRVEAGQQSACLISRFRAA